MVHFANFRDLPPGAGDLVHHLIGAEPNQHGVFASFFFGWMAFNAWMESVTSQKHDREMIEALARHSRLIAAYGEQMDGQNAAFRKCVGDFSSMWPVLSVRDVLAKLGNDAFQRLGREELLERCRTKKVTRRPEDWIEGNDPSWPQLLWTIYQVRCNLFHGSKSPHNDYNVRLVDLADCVLRKFIDSTGCFEWAE